MAARKLLIGLGFAVAAGLPLAPAAAQVNLDLVDHSAFRVCMDPANMPFSNKKEEGFENKIADLIAKDLGVPVKYTWFPQATGFIRNTLKANRCDVVMGVSLGYELTLNTNPYYYSTYALIYPKDGPLAGVKNLESPKLKDARIGVIAGTPPATSLARHDLIENAQSFQRMVDRRYFSPAEEMIKKIDAGDLDAGVLWGPIGGYFAGKSGKPLAVVPLINEDGGPRMAYRITMGVRHGETDWKHQLNDIIRKHKDDIDTILRDYHVPLLDSQGQVMQAADKSE